MASLTANAQLSFSEQANRTLDKDLIEIVEAVNSNQDDLLKFIPWEECNMLEGHKITRRSYVPEPTLRKDNEGVADTATVTQTVIEPTAMLEDRSEIDEKHLLRLPANKRDQYRRNEDIGHIEGMGQKFAKMLIWGTTNNAALALPEAFLGLQQRLNSTAQTTVISNGGSNGGSMTSIYVMSLGLKGAYCIYPAPLDSQTFMGLAVRNKGREFRYTSVANRTGLYKYVTQFQWACGLAVADELSIGRIPNIDVQTGSGYFPFNEDKLIELLEIGHFGPGTVIVMNKTIRTQARIRLKDKSNVNWDKMTGLSGKKILTFDEIPVIGLDTNIITNAESTIGA